MAGRSPGGRYGGAENLKNRLKRMPQYWNNEECEAYRVRPKAWRAIRQTWRKPVVVAWMQ
ncbi:hypothetical protein [Methylomonas rivi]|uniref:Transposase n=1 Tax=Methylomonas rivi TaxID=2952226 RepID=A0ABT1U976_9GAMM|nr:hypothetical protein [Methylomonas sp. WSC-6]MCQ8130410.1 hypothetical protein [Methylomonas sp. WSC-6]